MTLTVPAQHHLPHLNRIATWIVAVVALALVAVVVALTTARLLENRTAATISPVAVTVPQGETLAGLREQFTGRAAVAAAPVTPLAGSFLPAPYGAASFAGLREAFHGVNAAVPLVALVPAPPVGGPTLPELRAAFLGADAVDLTGVVTASNPWLHLSAEE